MEEVKWKQKRNSDNKPIIEAVDLMHYYDDGPSGEKEYSLQRCQPFCEGRRVPGGAGS